MRDSKLPPHGKKGFTLLEVLVAFALLSVMLITIIQSQSESVFFLEKTGKTEIARDVVFDELLKAERRFPRETSLSQQGTFPDDHPLAGDEWEKRIEVVSILGMIKVRKLTFQVIWDRDKPGAGAFESSIFGEAL